MRLLFLFIPTYVVAINSDLLIHYKAPGMYPKEEMSSSGSFHVPPNPYGGSGGDSEGPYLFYYEKDPPHPPGNKGNIASAGGSPFNEGSSADGSPNEGGKGQTKKSSAEFEGPVPPPKAESWAKYINKPSSSAHFSDSIGPSNGYEEEETVAQRKSTSIPASSPKREESTDSLSPIDPYEHSFSAGKDLQHFSVGMNSQHSSGRTVPSRNNVPGSHPQGGEVTDSLPPIDPYEHSKNPLQAKPGKTISIIPRDEITGGKDYRQDGGDRSVKAEELKLKASPDLVEFEQEITKLNLPVTEEESEESFKSLNEHRKPCCACCRGRVKEPVIDGGYIETVAPSPVVAGPNLSPPTLLNPALVIKPSNVGAKVQAQPTPIGFSPNPLIQSYFTPVQSSPVAYGGNGGNGCGCASPPQMCCQPVQPCCLPTLPCCPPPPPIPCCPQISICCQPVIPCCLPQITLPQICLPTIPLCFRGCPSCPCRRRRSIDDPRHHSRMKRQSCLRRAKRQSNCRQCSSNWNAITQAAGGCGSCNGSHRRIKRMGCLPCGRKKREALEEEAHIRQKRSCLPCLGGRKKRETEGQCKKNCSLLQTFVGRHKRSFNCSPCGGRKKRSPTSCSCASATPKRMKRAVREFDEIGQCDKSCCDYTKCGGLKARKLDLKN